MKKLSVPERITLDKQYLPGIGKVELKQLLIAGLPGLLITGILWFCLSDPGSKLICLICGMIYITICYAAVVKVDGSQSMYTFLLRIYRFRRGQKRYFYKNEKEALYVRKETQP